MFSRHPKKKSQSQIGSLIGVGTRIVGNVSFVGGLRIDGEVTGNVSSPGAEQGTLVLGEHAHVEGKLSAPHLLINGAVAGPMIATESVELQPHARIAGNIYYKSITMHPGAVVHGQLVHCISNDRSGELELVYGNAGHPATA